MYRKLFVRLARPGQWIRQARGGRVFALSLLLTALTAAGMLVGLRGSRAQSSGQQPDYSNVDDFTNGRTHLLRNDDLVLTFNYSNRGSLFSAGTANSSPAFLNYNQQTIPNGQAGCGASGGCNYDFIQYGGARPVTGRFFSTVNDTVVHYPVQLSGDAGAQSWLVSLTGNSSPPAAGFAWKSAQDISFVYDRADYDPDGEAYLSAVADFNNDGFDDLVMVYGNAVNTGAQPGLRIATAVDTNDAGKGFKFGPEFVANHSMIRALAVGDFNNDGHTDIASITWDYAYAIGMFMYVNIYQVDPNTLTVSLAATELVTQDIDRGGPHAFSMTAGRFSVSRGQELALGYQGSDWDPYTVQIIGFGPNSLQPSVASSWQVPVDSNQSILKLQAGRFDWSSPFDQIAMMSSSFQPGTRLRILTVDPGNLTITPKANYLFDKESLPFFGREIAIGNFDHQEQSASDPTARERDPDLQIALIGLRLSSDGSIKTAGVAILDVSDDFSTITSTSYSVLDSSYFGGNSLTDMGIAAGDLQGRSFRLGPGYKVTVDQTMPTVVLAVPPMHTDYVSPGIGQPPTVLNLSMVPDAFNTVYEESGGTTSSVTYTHTTSSSFSGEESINQKIALGKFDPISGNLENGVAVEDTFTAKQDIKGSNDTINGSFNSSDYEISQNTGLSDVVWFKDSSYYLYVYPVIGRKICPSDKAVNGVCADGDKVPMQVMFSAPKETTVQRLASDTLEWYQPPWEFGNLLSYPAGLAQMKQYIPDINLLTQEITSFATDDASATLKTTWSNGRTTGTNVTDENLFTEDNDLSIQGNYSVKLFGTGGAGSTKLDLNFGGSNGTKGLTESSTQFNSARGVTVNKKASFATPSTYKYFFSPYIFGKVKPVNYTDPVPSDPNGLLAYGTLRSGFAVDPLANGAGGWWSQSPYKQFPDVAVNHPNRWSYSAQLKPTNTNTLPLNCIGIDNTTMDCATPTERAADNPWLDPFHDMRGFFITDAANPPNSNPFVAGGGGAQLESATAGDKLTLSTRVYNYSFATMADGTKVKVRFYGMKWNTTTTFPADAVLNFNDDGSISVVNPGGGSFLIGETTLAPIAPFSNDPKAPLNWSVASTTFDTTGFDDQALVFWVAVWMEDANGNLVREVASHGLTGIPASTATPIFRDVTALEQLVANPLKQSDADPAQISFSNNIGFYKSAFHILAKTAPVSVATGAAAATVESVKVFGAAVKPGRSATANVVLRGGEQEVKGLTVYFYDGDPASGGRLVDAERIARLRAGDRQATNILFRPKECGSHQLFVRVVNRGAVIATGRAQQPVQVECSAPVCVSQVCMKSAQYYALNLNRLPQGLVTVAGAGLDARASTSDAAKMRTLLQGGAAAQQKFNQQFVAAQLNLLALPGGGQAALRSNLLCYKLNFQPAQLGTGFTLNPSMTLGDLFDQARTAAKAGRAADMRMIANLLQLLNGDDPQGRCR
jgi:hypothetical protein